MGRIRISWTKQRNVVVSFRCGDDIQISSCTRQSQSLRLEQWEDSLILEKHANQYEYEEPWTLSNSYMINPTIVTLFTLLAKLSDHSSRGALSRGRSFEVKENHVTIIRITVDFLEDQR